MRFFQLVECGFDGLFFISRNLVAIFFQLFFGLEYQRVGLVELINAFFYLAPCDSVLVPISFVLVVCIPQYARITVTKLVGAELFQTEHRCLAGSLVGVVSAVSTALGFMLYPVLAEKFSEREAQVIFALSSMLITLVWSMLPETAGVPMNDLNDNGTEAESKDNPYGSVSLNRAAFVGERVSLT